MNILHKLAIAAISSAILVLTTAFIPINDGHNEGRFGYVTNFGDGTVSVVDLIAGEIVQTIPTGSGAAGIANVPNRNKMFVANQLEGTVTVIDTTTNFAHDIFNDSLSSPVACTLTPDHRKMWVTLATKNTSGANGPDAPGAIAIFDVCTEAFEEFISLDAPFSYPVDVQFAGGHFAYVVDMFNLNPSEGGDLAVIDTNSKTIINHISVDIGSKPTSIAPLPNGKTLYVTGSDTFRIVAVDANTGDLTPIPTEFGSQQVVRNINGKFVWCANLGGTVAKIDTSTNTVAVAIPVDGAPIGITLSPDEKTIYSLNVGNATISAIDTKSNVVLRTFSIGSATTLPIEMAILQRQPVQP